MSFIPDHHCFLILCFPSLPLLFPDIFDAYLVYIEYYLMQSEVVTIFVVEHM